MTSRYEHYESNTDDDIVLAVEWMSEAAESVEAGEVDPLINRKLALAMVHSNLAVANALREIINSLEK